MGPRFVVFVLGCAGSAASLSGCSEPPRKSWDLLGSAFCEDRPDGIGCSDQEVARRCENGEIVEEQSCAADGKQCASWIGCVSCEPLAFTCKDSALFRCRADGSGTELVERCEGETVCAPGGCRDLCAEAAAGRSYIGCEYFPVLTTNSQLDPGFSPAVIVGNPNWVPARVRIERGDELYVEETVPPESALSIELPFVRALRGVPVSNEITSEPTAPKGSVLAQQGAYHLTTNVPVTAHQFNPLLFKLDKSDCSDPRNECFSFTNDASLLVPTHALRSQYVAIARGTFSTRVKDVQQGFRGHGGFLTIAAVEELPVEVSLTLTAHTQASQDGELSAHRPGDTFTVTLERGDVLQLLSAVPETCDDGYLAETDAFDNLGNGIVREMCDLGSSYDLTGTQISATGRVAVISGHDCAFVPFDRPACDHLEEQLFPIESWGKKVVVTRPRALANEPYRLRVVSAEDDNRIRFEPAFTDPVELDRGQFVELEADQHLVVRGSKPISVAQFLIGQGESSRSGDPSMGLAIPVDQYRRRYDFLSPPTFDESYVNVVAPLGARVTIDGEPLSGFERIGASSYAAAVHRLLTSGAHVLESEDAAVGAIVYGYAPYTSYMLPAGLDFMLLTAPPL